MDMWTEVRAWWWAVLMWWWIRRGYGWAECGKAVMRGAETPIVTVAGVEPAGQLPTAAGAAVALLEDPDGVRRFWGDVPSYVQAGQKLLARVEGLVEQAAEQGIRLKDVLKRV